MKISRKIVHLYRKVYNHFYSKQLKNYPTIISRDCIGGVLYSDYNLKFTSPTIGLEFTNDDFILFCNHLKSFVNCDLIEVKYKYPLGKLTCEYGTIYVHFKHYNNFNDALSAWDRRKLRIDYNNIYIIMCIGPNYDEKIIRQFEKIKYKHKILLSSGIDTNKYSNCFNMKCYDSNHNIDSLIQHKSKYGIKRYYDEVDWIKFFNER